MSLKRAVGCGGCSMHWMRMAGAATKFLSPHIAGLSCPITSSTHRYSLTISGDAETIPTGRHRALARLLLDTAGARGRVIK